MACSIATTDWFVYSLVAITVMTSPAFAARALPFANHALPLQYMPLKDAGITIVTGQVHMQPALESSTVYDLSEVAAHARQQANDTSSPRTYWGRKHQHVGKRSISPSKFSVHKWPQTAGAGSGHHGGVTSTLSTASSQLPLTHGSAQRSLKQAADAEAAVQGMAGWLQDVIDRLRSAISGAGSIQAVRRNNWPSNPTRPPQTLPNTFPDQQSSSADPTRSNAATDTAAEYSDYEEGEKPGICTAEELDPDLVTEGALDAQKSPLAAVGMLLSLTEMNSTVASSEAANASVTVGAGPGSFISPTQGRMMTPAGRAGSADGIAAASGQDDAAASVEVAGGTTTGAARSGPGTASVPPVVDMDGGRRYGPPSPSRSVTGLQSRGASPSAEPVQQGSGGGGPGEQGAEADEARLVSVERCTGALISGCHVITAGHCVFDVAKGAYTTNWRFAPGWTGRGAPLGVFGTAAVQVPRQFSEGRDPAFDIGIITLDVNDTSLAYFTLPPGQDPLPAPTPAAATAPAAAQPPSRTAVGSGINATAALIGGSAGTSAPTPDLALVPAAPGEKEGNSRFEVVHGGPGDDTYIVPVKPSRSADTTSPIRPGSGNDAGAGASPTGVTPPRTPSVQAPSGDRGNAVRTAPRNSQYSANATSAGIASGVSGPSLIPLPDAAGQDLTNVLATPAPAANTSTAVLTRNVTALLPAVGGVSTAANGSSNISSVDGAWSGGCLNYAGYPSSRALWVQLCQTLGTLGSRFIETNCAGKQGVSGAPMWTLTHSNATANATAAGSSNTTDVSGTSSLPVQNATGRAMDPAAATPTAAVGTAAAAASGAVPHSTSGGTAAAPGTTAYSASSLVSADSANQAVHPQRVLRAVLTAGIPGGPTAAVRIDPSMAAWIRRWQVLHPCPAA